jgi:dynein heavy chain
LARAVNLEQPELEAKKQALVAAFQQYKIKLHELEDNLLDKLANAPDDILSDVALIEGLEETKIAVTEINAAVEEGHHTEAEINKAREVYRPVAYEGSMLYFMLTQLCNVQHFYQYSLDSFLLYFARAVHRATANPDITARVKLLQASLRLTIFTWVARGLFEQHKLLFLTQLTFSLIKRGKIEDLSISPQYYDFLMRCPRKPGDEKPEQLAWLPDSAYASVMSLCDCEDFSGFGGDLVEASPRFREWYNHVTSETEKLPLDWASLEKEPIKKMMVVRCLRPDRMRVALTHFCETVLPNGKAYSQCDSSLNSLEVLTQSFADSSPITPIFFILSRGSDVVSDLDKLSASQGLEKGVSYHNVSMGQGQDVVAMERLEQAHRNGHWVILNNIHLMPRWCVELEKKLDANALEGPHERGRLFLSAEPSDAIPIGILNRCIKLTNEPPGGLKANLKRAWCNFNKDYIDEADSKTKVILFALCQFHAVLMERKLFGPLGYNMQYPFSLGDLRDSAV